MLTNMNSPFHFFNIWTSFVRFLLITALVFNLSNTLAKPDPTNKKELPLEISEKHYKKEAILKFNSAVQKWEAENKDLASIKEAIKLWEEALSIDPNLWLAYLGLGQAYEKTKEYKKAYNSYKKYLDLSPSGAHNKETVKEALNYLSRLLRHGEDVLAGSDYLSLVQTNHEDKDLYVRFELNKPLSVYFFPAKGIQNYREEFKDAFLEGAMIWQEALPDLKFEIIDNAILEKLKDKKRAKKEKELIDQSQIKVIFPSRFKVKGDPKNPIAKEFDAHSFPIIRDKKNFRVLGVIMVSPFIYFQSQIAIPLEPLSKLSQDDQIKKLKIIGAREVGHALGLWGFSPNPDDFMYEGEVTEIKLSKRDKNTIQKLYDLNPETDNVLTNN